MTAKATDAVVSVALALLKDPRARHWGYDLSKQSGVRSGVMYPVLHNMLDEGWLVDGWDSEGWSRRHPRRYYEITAEGLEQLGALVANVPSVKRPERFIERFA